MNLKIASDEELIEILKHAIYEYEHAFYYSDVRESEKKITEIAQEITRRQEEI